MDEFREELIGKLKEIIDEDRIEYDPAVTIAYTRDSSFLLSGIADTEFIVVQPLNKEEIQGILRLANKMNIKVLTKGIGSNIVGLTIPHFTHILIDLKRMRNIERIDEEFQVAIIEPGVTHAQLAREAMEKGLKYIGPGAPYSTSVIGNIAYTAMKPGATKYGQDQVLALEVVLPTGDLLYTGTWTLSYLKDITPFYRHVPLLDLNNLFLFTRGSFGIITKAAIRLYPIGEVDRIFMTGFDDIKDMNSFAREIQLYEIPSLLMAISGSYVPRFINMPGRVEREISNVPENILLVEVDGLEKQVEVNIEILMEKLAKFNGRLIEDIEYEELVKMVPPVRYSPRMMQPYGSMIPSVCYAPTKYTADFIKEARKIIKNKYGMDSEYVIYYQYQGLNTYVEIDIHYNPIDEDIKSTLISILKELSMLKRKFKCASTSAGEFSKTGLYYELALKIKKMIDPNDILNVGRFFKEV